MSARNSGDNPNGPAPAGPYDPAYIAVAHMVSTGWNVSAIHAHFSADGLDEAGRLGLAAQLMEAKLANHERVFDYPGAPQQPYVNSEGQICQYENFENFRFNSQHDLFFFFEHAPGEITFKQGDLVEFGSSFRDGNPAAPNFAFFAAEDVTGSVPDPLRGAGTLVRLENHFRKQGNAPIDPKIDRITYKLCLVYTAGSGIAMIIDPDTGNGGGHNP